MICTDREAIAALEVRVPAMNAYEIANIMKLAICMAAIAGLWLAYRYPESLRLQRIVDRGFVALAGLALVGYINFGFFHGGVGYIHTWEMFHYHLPSKYQDEIGYFGLYEAALVADAESEAPYFDKVDYVRDLHTYSIVGRDKVLAASTIRENFTAEGWSDFSRDVDFYKVRYPPERWKFLFQDHGYNAPPSRTLVTGSVSRILGDADTLSLYLIGLIDPILLGLLLWVVYHTYGLRLAALATVLFGANMLSEFIWIGGAFLRFDWLVLSGFGICAVRTERYGLAGALLGAASMLRIFPVLFAAGVVLRGVFQYSESRIWHTRYTRFLVGIAASGLGMLAMTFLGMGGLDVWGDFVAKIGLHHGETSANRVGLFHLVGENSLLLFAARGAILTAYLLSLRKLANDSQAAILGGVLLFALGSLSCYYYAFLIFFLFWQSRRSLDFQCWLFFSLLFMTQIVVIGLRMSGWTQTLVPQAQLSFVGASLMILVSSVVLLNSVYRPARSV